MISLVFLSASRLAWQAALKKTKEKIDLLTDIDTVSRFGTWNFELDRPLLKGKKNRLMKEKLGWKIMAIFFELKAKIYSYLLIDGSEDK